MEASSTPSIAGSTAAGASRLSDRSAWIRLALIAFIAVAVSGAQLFFLKSYVPLLQLVAVIVLGGLFARLGAAVFPTRYVLYALLVSLSLTLLPTALAFLQEEAFLVNAAWLAVGFILPSVLVQAWRSNQHIPEFYKTVWAWSDEEPETKAANFLESDRLKLRVIVPGKRTCTVSTIAPLSFTLGKVFVQALAAGKGQANWKAEVTDARGESYDWLFYQRHWGFYKTWMDGEESLWQNRVTVKKPIFVKRV